MPIVPPVGSTLPLASGPTQSGNNAGPYNPQSPAENPSGGGNFPAPGSRDPLTMGRPWDAAAQADMSARFPWQKRFPGIYLPTQRKAIQLESGESALLLDVPEGIRLFFKVRLANASDEDVGINYGSQVGPVDPSTGTGGGFNTCDEELRPGEAISYDGDGIVPQDRIYIRAAGVENTNAFVVVTWCDWNGTGE